MERPQRCLQNQSPGDSRGPSEPLTRTDCILIGRAIRDGWDVPEAKRQEIVLQTLAALKSDDEWLTLAAVRLVVLMEAANHAKR